MTVRSAGPEHTESLGASLAGCLRPGDVITLEAPLGGGKTTFVRGLARGLGVDESEVSSPTFVIWQIYSGRLRLHHLDAYRLRTPEELEELGFLECLDQPEVVVLEWPGVAASLLPADRLQIEFKYVDETDMRDIDFQGLGSWAERLASWRP